ncbi:Protein STRICTOSIDINE SYNTHASE-LIKE 5 [Frankliniella fusca]|uniref:Protein STRICTOSIDINE SYNTHASE-LIKE 5 n=1 Tax=Frankliniella fusca TaxID=407009 RepID=A0AAE1HGL5_9NEOP|nr:Protein STRICTOSIDINE SYNTHASE-LIKE 5 [Frankliniella fusca]
MIPITAIKVCGKDFAKDLFRNTGKTDVESFTRMACREEKKSLSNSKNVIWARLGGHIPLYGSALRLWSIHNLDGHTENFLQTALQMSKALYTNYNMVILTIRYIFLHNFKATPLCVEAGRVEGVLEEGDRDRPPPKGDRSGIVRSEMKVWTVKGYTRLRTILVLFTTQERGGGKERVKKGNSNTFHRRTKTMVFERTVSDCNKERNEEIWKTSQPVGFILTWIKINQVQMKTSKGPKRELVLVDIRLPFLSQVSCAESIAGVRLHLQRHPGVVIGDLEGSPITSLGRSSTFRSSALLVGAERRRCSSALNVGAAHWRCSSALLVGAARRRYSSALLVGAERRRCSSALLVGATRRR